MSIDIAKAADELSDVVATLPNIQDRSPGAD